MTHAAVEPAPDVGLAARAARGDTDAYALLVRQHHASCLRYAERMLGDAADAEDAVQDTFMRAFLAIGRFDTVVEQAHERAVAPEAGLDG